MSVKIRKFILVLVAGKQILGLMHEFREARASGSPEFVETGNERLVRREEHQPKRFGLGIMRWAAALMFSMAAGYGFSVSEGGTKSIEWVASLAIAPNPIASIETLGFPYPLLPSWRRLLNFERHNHRHAA